MYSIENLRVTFGKDKYLYYYKSYLYEKHNVENPKLYLYSPTVLNAMLYYFLEKLKVPFGKHGFSSVQK